MNLTDFTLKIWQLCSIASLMKISFYTTEIFCSFKSHKPLHFFACRRELMACLTPNWPISLQIYAESDLTILGTLRLRDQVFKGDTLPYRGTRQPCFYLDQHQSVPKSLTVRPWTARATKYLLACITAALAASVAFSLKPACSGVGNDSSFLLNNDISSPAS